jgi:hypothetical protein
MSVFAWLFLRGEQSIRLVREASGFVLRIEGPGYERQVHAFKDEAEVSEFQQEYENGLLSDGWVLGASQERRAGGDRRSENRGGPDRRRRD